MSQINLEEFEFKEDLGTNSLDITHVPSNGSGSISLDAVDLGGDLDLAGSSITDSSQGYLDLTGDGNDLRLGTGQSIEDGNANKRLSIDSNRTLLQSDVGNIMVQAQSGSFHRLIALNGTPLDVYDNEGGFSAIKYTTDTSAGVLRTPNAGLVVEGDYSAIAGAGAGIQQWFDGSVGHIRAYDEPNSTMETLQIKGSPVEIGGTGGLVDMSINSANLRIATGQAIEDGSGTRRVDLSSTRTVVRDENGEVGISLKDGTAYEFRADSDTPWRVFDDEGVFTALEYTTGASTGTLKFTNADLQMRDNGQIRVANVAGGTLKVRDPYNANDIIRFNEGGSVNIHGINKNLSHSLVFQDNDGTVQTEVRGDSGTFSVLSSNLRLATGQSIEDGGGTDRFELRSQDTVINAESGVAFHQINDGNYNRLIASNPTPVQIFDKEGSFVSVQYISASSAPGTLELTNANLQMTSGGSQIRFPQAGSNDTATPKLSYTITNNVTELTATDGAGNIATLT